MITARQQRHLWQNLPDFVFMLVDMSLEQTNLVKIASHINTGLQPATPWHGTENHIFNEFHLYNAALQDCRALCNSHVDVFRKERAIAVMIYLLRTAVSRLAVSCLCISLCWRIRSQAVLVFLFPFWRTGSRKIVV